MYWKLQFVSPKTCVSKETKDIKLKYLIWKQTKMKIKQYQNIFYVIVNANSVVQHAIQNKNGIIKHFNVNIKIIVCAKKIIVGILAHVLVRIVFKKYCW